MWAFPGERRAKAFTKELTREELLAGIADLPPKQCFGMLLWCAKVRGHKNGACFYAFIEIYGARPKFSDQQTEPIYAGGTIVEEWYATRKKKRAGEIRKTLSRPECVDARSGCRNTRAGGGLE